MWAIVGVWLAFAACVALILTGHFLEGAGALLLADAPVAIPEAIKTKLEELGKNLDRQLAQLEPAIKQAKDAQKGTAEMKEEVAKISERNAELADSIKEGIENLRKELTERQDTFETLMNKRRKSIEAAGRWTQQGDAFVKALSDSIAANEITRKRQGSFTFEFKSWELGYAERMKEITNDPASGGDLIVPYYVPGIIAPGTRSLTVRDLLPVGQVSTQTVIFMRELSVTDNAGPQEGEGTLKPESDFTFEDATETVQTIAHWVLVSTQMLDDVAQLRSYLDTRMRFLLLQEEEDQLLYGSGTGNELNGLFTQATAYDATLETQLNVSNVTDIDRLRIAMLQVQLAEFPPSGLIFNPFNWAALELTKDAENRYIFVSPQNTTVPRMWGLPVVATTGVEQGDFLVGAFALAAQIWDRQEAAIAISTEDADNFRRNRATVRAEERLALTVYRPLALVEGSFAATGSGS